LVLNRPALFLIEDRTMALIVISVDRDKLPPHTDEEFEEWVRFEVGDGGSIETKNPLSKEGLEARVREI
jgi:hypothetical protein